MGVRGLTTFADENEKDLFDVTYIHDTPIVVDGSGTMFYLSGFTPHPSPVCQEYSSQAFVIREFIRELRHCGVSPYFMFDGPSTIEKRDKVLATLNGNVEALEEMFHGDGEQRLLPPYTLQTMIQVLKDLHVPYVMSLDDADAELAALANKLNCPVLAEDSDFLIFGVKEGYIPLKKLAWAGNAEIGNKELRCLKSSASKLANVYNINETQLPFLSVLLGNDWLPSDIFSDTVFGFSRKYGVRKLRKTWRVESVIKWLRSMHGEEDDSILDQLHKSLPYVDREKNIQSIRYSLDLYRNLPDITQIWRMIQRDDDPNWVREQNLEFAIRTSLVHFSTSHLVKENLVCLPSAIVSDTDKLSPHTPSIDIRQCAYRLLLRRFCLETEGPQVLGIEEYDMVDVAYKVARGWNIYTAICPLCETRHKFNEICTTGGGPGILNTSQMVFRILGDEDSESPAFGFYCDDKLRELFDNVVTSDFRLRLDIVMLSTIFWIKKTNPKPVFIISLVTVFAICIKNYLIRRNNFIRSKEVTPVRDAQNCEQAASSCIHETGNVSGGCANNDNISEEAALKDVRKDINNGTDETMSGGVDTNTLQGSLEQKKLSGDSDEIPHIAEDSKGDVENHSAKEKQVFLEPQWKKKTTSQVDSDKLKKVPNDAAETPKVAEDVKKSENKSSDEKQSVTDDRMSTSPIVSDQLKKASSDSAATPANNQDMKKSGVKSTDEKPAETEKQVFLRPQWMKRPSRRSEPDQAKKGSSDSSANENQSAVSPPAKEIRLVRRTKFCPILDSLAPPPPVESLMMSGRYQWIIFVDKFPVDLELLHSGAEWSCVAFAVFMLYQAIEYDETNFGINDIFGSNMLLHEINARLHKAEDLDINEDLQHISSHVLKSLESEPVIRKILEEIVNYLLLAQK